MAHDARPRLSEDTHLNLRMGTIKYQQQIGRPISISDLVTAAWQVAQNHPDELSKILRETKGNETEE